MSDGCGGERDNSVPDDDRICELEVALRDALNTINWALRQCDVDVPPGVRKRIARIRQILRGEKS